MPLGLGSSQWAVILPKEATNLATNPSLERGTANWSALAGGAAIGSTSQYQTYGAWSLFVTPTITSEGAYYDAGTIGAGSYSASAWIKGSVGAVYRLEPTESSAGGVLSTGSTTATGAWQILTTTFGMPGGTGLQMTLRAIPGNTGTFYADGLMLESGTNRTTYIDGDQSGGQWLGAPHQSQSKRSGQYRGGGTVIALGDLGFRVDQMPGAGVPPVEVSVQSFAVVDGAQFQRQRAGARQLTLTAQPFLGTTLADFHVTRRTVYDALKPDAVNPQQPVRFLYVGGQGTSQIDAYYQNGMELGEMNGPMAEKAAVSFLATDPFFYSPTQQGTTLAPFTSLGSVRYIARRNSLGAWGTMGVAGTTITASGASASGITAVRSLAFNPNGTLFLGGWWGSVGGTLSPNIGMYFPQENRFGTLTGGTIDQVSGQLLGVTFNPGGTLFFAGQFTSFAGTSHNHVGRWNGAYGTLVGGTISSANFAWTVFYSPLGSLFIGGDFTSAAATVCNSIAFWNGANFGTLGGTARNGANAPQVQSFGWGLDNRLYFAGGITTIQGTQGTAIGFWKNGALGTLQNPIANGGNAGIIEQISVGPDGRVWEAGQITNIASGSALGGAVWNGIQQSNLGSGFGFQSGFNNSSEAWCVLADGSTGNVFYGGVFTKIGDVNVAANYTTWNGYTFLPPDIGFIGGGFTLGTVYAIAKSPTGELYIAGNFQGTAQAASVGTIINAGRAQAYPTLRVRHYGVSGTARIYQLLNTVTGDGIYFNLTLLAGEQITLNLTPGARSFTSNFRGNVMGAILPGSNLATWSLLPGTNYISFFSDSGSIDASFYWQPRGWAADSGTNY